MRNKTKRILPRLPLVGSLAAIAFLVFAPEAARAQTQLFACYLPNSGVVYRVNPPDEPGQNADLNDDCTGKKHVKFFWNEPGGGLVLPFAGDVSSDGAAFSISNTGTGPAVFFSVENPSNAGAVLEAGTNSGSGPAVVGFNNGSGQAGQFLISNNSNASAALEASTTGTGRAGTFSIDNAGSTEPAIAVATNGLGEAGVFHATNPGNGESALRAFTEGTGRAGTFTIDNPSNSSPALFAFTQGSGLAALLQGNVEVTGNLVVSGGDAAVTLPGSGVILKATDGANCYRITVNNVGTLSTTAVTCP